MKVLVVLTAALTWSNLLNVEGHLLEQREALEGARGFFPTPFFPPYQPAYSPGVYPPYNVPPQCFLQPVITEVPVVVPEIEPLVCPVCPVAESCTCEPVLNACQTYSITVCPSGVPSPLAATVVEEVIDKNRIVDVLSGQDTSEKLEVVDVTPNNPSMFGPMSGFTPYPGFNQLVGGGMFPQFGGFQGQFGSTLGQFGANPTVTAVRSLEDDQESGHSGDKEKKK